MDWRHRAACLTEDPELFFPIGNTGPALMQIAEAKKVCRRCEVREACLQWALDAGPVSYTHLDVYKRQSIVSTLVADLGGEFKLESNAHSTTATVRVPLM